MIYSLDSIAHALGGAKATPTGWICKCPCHDDNNASLSITLSPKGELICNCFVGCEWEAIKKELEQRRLLEPFKPSSQNGLAVRKPRFNKYDGAIFYVYKDIAGNPVCRKVKFPAKPATEHAPAVAKRQWFERLEGGQWLSKLEGIVVPLYNLQAVLASKEPIYLCEGEKDAETLISAGLVATTNHSGAAANWLPHMVDPLKGKTVVVIPDNDEPGRKRIAKVSKALQGHVKELRFFEPKGVPEHGDITNWVENGGNPADIWAQSTIIEKKEEGKKATREDYYQLFEEVLKGPRKCIFSGKLMFKEEDSGLWNPCINSIDILKSEAVARNETSDRKFNKDDILPHLAFYERSKPREFLVDIPEWDGHDRISGMAYLITLKPEAGVSEQSFSELLKEWCALVFKRMEDPMVQNRVLVLQGGQGIGKDTWTSMLVDGLGQFCVPLNVVGEDKDTYLSLTSGLVMKISEFDKTSRTEVSTLKDLITAPSTNIRAPYDKDSKLRVNRCSFISSANAEQLLRDSTGNRRFMIFEVASIKYAYEDWTKNDIADWQAQCLAQMKELARMNYKASDTSWREMREYIEGKTPEDFIDDIASHWLQLYRAYEASNLLPMASEIRVDDLVGREISAEVAKKHSVKLATVRAGINTRFCVQKRIGGVRVRVLRLPS